MKKEKNSPMPNAAQGNLITFLSDQLLFYFLTFTVLTVLKEP